MTKRIIAIILVLTIALSFVACSTLDQVINKEDDLTSNGAEDARPSIPSGEADDGIIIGGGGWFSADSDKYYGGAGEGAAVAPSDGTTPIEPAPSEPAPDAPDPGEPIEAEPTPSFDGDFEVAISYIADGGYVRRVDGYYKLYSKDGKVVGSVSDEEAYQLMEIRAGMLTACAYDDHGNMAYWQGLLTSTQEGPGKFKEYFEQFDFKALRQIKVTVEGVPGAHIQLLDGDTVLCETLCDRAGVGYLYAPDRREGLKVNFAVTTEMDIAHVKDAADEVVFTHEEVGNYPAFDMNAIEVMFVIDTTGSMGDEIDYLKKEIADVIDRIKEQTGADVTLAIMVYRDTTDEYVTRYSDFSRDIAKQQAFLSQQEAMGGGDFEEAVDVALTEAVDKQWSANSTKILIHVADAPAHDELVGKWSKAVTAAAKKGIRILSVASSGIDQKTEYFFRSQSLLTGGVYVYLTDDSGIGGGHLEATVEERPKVEYLNDCLVRLIGCLYEGRTPDQVIQLKADKPAEPDPQDPTPTDPTDPNVPEELIPDDTDEVEDAKNADGEDK